MDGWGGTCVALRLEVVVFFFSPRLPEEKLHTKTQQNWTWSVEGRGHVQQGQLVLPPDEGVLLVHQHEPLLHHGLLLLLVVA